MKKPTAFSRLDVDTRGEIIALAHVILRQVGCSPRDPLWAMVKSIPDSDSDLSHAADLALASVDVMRYSLVSQLRALYSKNPALTNDRECEEACLKAFHKAERQCRRTNRRLALTARGLIGRQYMPYILKAQRIIATILGTKPLYWLHLGKHGNGAAIGCKGIDTSPAFKYASFPYAVTDGCAAWFRYMVETSPLWHDLVDPHPRAETPRYFTEVPSTNRFATVPKNWKTHRGICVEPIGNVYVQQGLGREIAARLKRHGVNIFDDGQARHRELARTASRLEGVYGDSPVTLDLSMASDTLATELVRLLLPDAWFWALDCARCHGTTLPGGEVVRTSKFSSMGNAATFPLETLVFYALSLAVTGGTCHSGTVSAYGDDIIVPRGSALLLSEVLRWCGFTVNPAKSFIFGEFYESCGADYLGGVPVRPFYLKRDLRCSTDWFMVGNAAGDARYYSLYGNTVRDYVHRRHSRHAGNFVLFGPARDHEVHGIPDCWFETSDVGAWDTRVNRGVRKCRGLVRRALTSVAQDESVLLAAMQAGGATSNDTAAPHGVRLRRGYLVGSTRQGRVVERYIRIP